MTVDLIIKAAAIISALGVIGAASFKLVRWVMRQDNQDNDISEMKEENTLICYCIMACLDGLEQLGCNHTVPDAKNKMQKHLNLKAHDQKGKKE